MPLNARGLYALEQAQKAGVDEWLRLGELWQDICAKNSQEYEQLPAEQRERLERQAAEQMAQYAEAAQAYVDAQRPKEVAAQAPKAAGKEPKKVTEEALDQRAGPATPDQPAQLPAQ